MSLTFILGLALLIQSERASDCLPERLPERLALQEQGPQTYHFRCEYVVADADDQVRSRQLLEADCVRDPGEGRVRWTRARLAQAEGLDGEYAPPRTLDYLENFSYSSQAGWRMFMPGFFRGFPEDSIAAYAKNLIWDTHMLEGFARAKLGQLELGVSEPLVGASGSSVPLGGMGAFRNREVSLTWLGRSRRNGEACALLAYEAFFNRFEMDLPAASMHGGSHYWGQLWVSLEDGQLEHATLDELVTLTTTGEGGAQRRNRVLRRGRLTRMPPAPDDVPSEEADGER